MQLQPSFAHFWGVVAISSSKTAGSTKHRPAALSDARQLHKDVSLPAAPQQMLCMF
jgi:hypothetical protein